MNKNPHILIIRLSALGDVAMTVPVIRALREQYVDIRITVLSKPFHEAIFQTIPNVNFIAVDTKNKHKGIFGLWQLFLELKGLKITHIADFHNVLRSKILLKFFGLNRVEKAKINKGRQEKKQFICKEIKPLRTIKNTFERYKDVLSKLGFSVDLSQPNFPNKQSEILDKLSLSRDKILVGFAPFAHYETKTYPIDLSREFLELCENKPWQILLFGGKDELSKLETLAKDLSNVKIVAGQLNFKQELNLMAHLDLMISMDSANAHLAAMQGVKVLTLWGNTHPMLGFSPFNQPDDYALIADINKFPLVPTSVFGDKFIKGYEDVMRTISPDSIVELVEKTLKQI